MTALTPLGQQRADTTACGQAARALRAGCRPEAVAASLAVYCGQPLEREPVPRFPGDLSAVEHLASFGVSGTVYLSDGLSIDPAPGLTILRDEAVEAIFPRDHRKPRRWSR